MPKEIKEATSAATANAVPVLSVSTTVRTPPVPTAAGLTPVGVVDLETIGVEPPAGLGPGKPGPGIGGLLLTGKAAVAPGATCFPAPATPGLGGRAILMVSFRRSAGGLPPLGMTGGEVTGFGGTGMAGTGAAGGVLGFGGGASRIVSFFKAGTPGTEGRGGLEIPGAAGFGAAGVGSGGLIVGKAMGEGGLRPDAGGGPGGRGGGGGKGTPSAI